MDVPLPDAIEPFLNQLIVGDCVTAMKSIPSSSVHAVITSPPYWKQRNYEVAGAIGNEDDPSEYVERLRVAFAECVRVTRSDGHIVFNVGDKYENGSLLLLPYEFARVASKERAVKLINLITWVKKNPTPRQDATKLEPSTEPFFDFVKSNDYYYDPDSFVASEDKKSRLSIKKSAGESYFADIERSSLAANQKANAKTALKEAIAELKRGEITGMRMKIKGIHAVPYGGQDGGWTRKFDEQGFVIMRHKGKSAKRDVIESSVGTDRVEGHPAIFPESVVTEIMRLICPPKGIVLDPFVGSGTTAVVAKKEGRQYIGIDINPAYIEIAKERIASANQSISRYFGKHMP